MSKIVFEINTGNDALQRDLIGETLRMIKLAIRKTELKAGCDLLDINGQIVGSLKIEEDTKYSEKDFKVGDIVNLTFIDDGKKLTLNDITIQTVRDNCIQFETEVFNYMIDYKDIINASILGL